MSQKANKPKRPQFYNGVRVRMPQDYNFNTLGKDFSEYQKDFILRTDAVWEKQQLRDWFRLTNKVFYFNTAKKKYQFIEPQQIYSIVFEPWGFQDQQIMDWHGFSATGRTTCFQTSQGPKDRVQNTFNSFYSMPDYYMMCAMRFQKWFKCDMIYGADRTKHFDRNPEIAFTKQMRPQHQYPCFREYYQSTYACADNILKFLIELSYHKKARGFFKQLHQNKQIKSFPNIYDSPKQPQSTVTYTY